MLVYVTTLLFVVECFFCYSFWGDYIYFYDFLPCILSIRYLTSLESRNVRFIELYTISTLFYIYLFGSSSASILIYDTYLSSTHLMPTMPISYSEFLAPLLALILRFSFFVLSLLPTLLVANFRTDLIFSGKLLWLKELVSFIGTSLKIFLVAYPERKVLDWGDQISVQPRSFSWWRWTAWLECLANWAVFDYPSCLFQLIVIKMVTSYIDRLVLHTKMLDVIKW